MGNMSPEEEAKLKEDVKDAFDKIDTNKSGMIDKKEFRALCERVAQNMGNQLKEKEFEELFQKFDKDNSGLISFQEAYNNWPGLSMLIAFDKE